MKRLVLSVAAAAVLAMVSVGGVFAANQVDQPVPPAGCPMWGGGVAGGYDLSNNPALKIIADKLSMSTADLSKELQSGKSVADVASARSVDLQGVVDALMAPRIEMSGIMVKYGYLTQEQADSMQKYMADRVKVQLQTKGGIGGYGMMGPGFQGGRGMMGPGFGNGRGMMGPGFGPGGWGNSQNAQ